MKLSTGLTAIASAVVVTAFTISAFYSFDPEKISISAAELNPMNDVLTIYSVPTTFLPQNESSWNQIEEKILTTNKKTVVLYWSGLGGETYQATKFKNIVSIAQKQGKTIIIEVLALSASSHAYAICGADKINIHQGASLLFHSGFSRDKDGKKNYNNNPGQESELADMLGTCANRFKLTVAQAEDIVLYHKAVFMFLERGKLVSETSEDLE